MRIRKHTIGRRKGKICGSQKEKIKFTCMLRAALQQLVVLLPECVHYLPHTGDSLEATKTFF
jgi:hypothetical protein